MRYTCKTNINELRTSYDYLVGWGAGRDEYDRRYNLSLYQLDYMIDVKKRTGENPLWHKDGIPGNIKESCRKKGLLYYISEY